MQNTGDRIDQFKSDVEEMKLRTGNVGREKMLQAVGVILMLAGFIGGIVCYVGAKNATGSADIAATHIQEQIVLAIWFAIMSLIGAVMFLRYSLANLVRMWLLRQMYEGQSNTERLIEAMKN